jgi:hypothetical protein
MRVYAAMHDKTMTQVIEELIDGLPEEEFGQRRYVVAPQFIPRSPYGLRHGASYDIN